MFKTRYRCCPRPPAHLVYYENGVLICALTGKPVEPPMEPAPDTSWVRMVQMHEIKEEP